MPEIQSPDPGRKLQEKYGLVGSSPAPFLSPELVPVVLIDDLTDSLPGFAWASAAREQAAVVGQNPQTAIVNRAGSGILLTSIRLAFTHAGTAVLSAWENGPALSTGVSETWEDRRRTGNPSALVTVGTDVGAVTVPIRNLRTLSSTVVRFDFSHQVLAEGDKIHVLLELANQVVNFHWNWAEVERV